MNTAQFEQALAPVLDLDIGTVFAALLLSLILSLVVALTYRFSVPGRVLSPAMQSSLILLAMVATMVMMVIGNNIARAFSLVGALAIVRFRTRLASPWDISFVFFSLAVGIACGVLAFRVAVVGTMMISLTIIALSILPLAGVRSDRMRLLRCDIGAFEGTEEALQQALEKYVRRSWLLEARSLRFGETLSYRFRIELKSVDAIPLMLRELSDLETVERVLLDFEDRDVGVTE